MTTYTPEAIEKALDAFVGPAGEWKSESARVMQDRRDCMSRALAAAHAARCTGFTIGYGHGWPPLSQFVLMPSPFYRLASRRTSRQGCYRQAAYRLINPPAIGLPGGDAHV